MTEQLPKCYAESSEYCIRRSTGAVSMMEEKSYFHVAAALYPRKAPPFPLDIRLPGTQSRAVCFGGQKKTCSFAGNEPPIPRSSSH